MLNKRQIQAALDCDMFEGDYADFDVVFQDKIVTGRCQKECSWCGEITKPKTHHRVIKAIYEGKHIGYRYCEKCCRAMACLELGGSDMPLENRFKGIGQ